MGRESIRNLQIWAVTLRRRALLVLSVMICSTGKLPSWVLRTHHTLEVSSSSPSTSLPTTHSSHPRSTSPPESTTQISTPTVPCLPTPTLMTHSSLRSPTSTRPTDPDTRLQPESGHVNMRSRYGQGKLQAYEIPQYFLLARVLRIWVASTSSLVFFFLLHTFLFHTCLILSVCPGDTCHSPYSSLLLHRKQRWVGE